MRIKVDPFALSGPVRAKYVITDCLAGHVLSGAFLSLSSGAGTQLPLLIVFDKANNQLLESGPNQSLGVAQTGHYTWGQASGYEENLTTFTYQCPLMGLILEEGDVIELDMNVIPTGTVNEFILVIV